MCAAPRILEEGVVDGKEDFATSAVLVVVVAIVLHASESASVSHASEFMNLLRNDWSNLSVVDFDRTDLLGFRR